MVQVSEGKTQKKKRTARLKSSGRVQCFSKGKDGSEMSKVISLFRFLQRVGRIAPRALRELQCGGRVWYWG